MKMRRILAPIALITLGSCGGGGGGSSGMPGPMAKLDSTSLNYQVLYVEQYPVTVTPDPTAFTFANFIAAPNVKLSAPTTGGINSLSFTMADATHGGITFTLKTPSTLSQNAYDTPITVNVYADSTGNILVSTFTVTLHYVVTNSFTVTGPNGYTITALPVATDGLAGNATQNAIYADVLTDPSSGAYSVEALDPTNGGSIHTPVPGATPGILALSDDGQFLYAEVGGHIERLQASSLAANLTLPTSARSVAVAPGLPQTVAVATDTALQIFDNAMARPNSVPVPPPNSGLPSSYGSLQWGSQSAVYAEVNIGGIGPPPSICAFAVNSMGVTATGSCGASNVVGSYMTFANGRGYPPGGNIVDPTTWTVVGTLSGAPGLGTVTPDTTLNKAFAYVQGGSGGCWIQSFNLSTGAAIASVRLPTINGGNGNGCSYSDTVFFAGTGINSLVRFGANGIAIGTDVRFAPGYVVVISGAFVAP
jgi:hypothetical protein